MNIDIEIARKVLETVDAGLVNGLGTPEPGKMCVEAAVNYALGLPHGDEPACVAPSLRALKIRLNDSRWSSPQARAAGLRRLALIQLGSAGALDERDFVHRVVRLAIQFCVPQALRAAATICKNKKKGAAMLIAAEICEREPTRDNALRAQKAAHAAHAANAAASAADYAAAYAADAADAAAYDAAYAAHAACIAAHAAANAAAHAAAHAASAADYAAAYAAHAAYAAANAASAAYADSALAAFAERVVQILIEMKVPGVRWLKLTEVRPYFARPA